MDIGRTAMSMNAQGLLSSVSRDNAYGSLPSQRRMNDFLSVLGQKTGEARETENETAEEAARADLDRKQQQLQEKQDMRQELEMMRRELENSRKQADAMADEFEVFSKCMAIAARITRGDIVPMKDMKYLAEHEPDLYKQAILMRMPNDHPKKHKSLVEDEQTEESQSSGNADSSGEDQAAEEIPAAEGAADTAETSGSAE